ncbi:type I methionyl aminopeptidase [Thiospirochaeta perfilievii]|nr:type I methionyl aminopeptidase [Thiospirochaeta perfilievii]
MAMIKTEKEIKEITIMADLITELINKSLSWVKPGITTFELDKKIEDEMNKMGVNGPCKGYHGFPCVSCLSVNESVTHGIPDDRVLLEGDIIDIDLVIERNGYYSDCSRTIAVGKISSEAQRLIDVTEECLYKGIKAAQPGNTLGDIGFAIQSHAESNGYSVVREYCGHFIGLDMHESPSVTNYGTPGVGEVLKPGMIFCIEPMINQGRRAIRDKNWVTKTRDGKLSSRCEHMVLITETGNKVLTKHIEPKL